MYRRPYIHGESRKQRTQLFFFGQRTEYTALLSQVLFNFSKGLTPTSMYVSLQVRM